MNSCLGADSRATRQRVARTMAWIAIIAASGALSSCGSGSAAPDHSGRSSSTETRIAAGTIGAVRLADRPFRLQVPRQYDPNVATALVVALHGWGAASNDFATRLALYSAADERTFLLALPEGTKDADDLQFWNATDVCCDAYGTNVDDSSYLSQVIDAVASRYTVDPGRVFVIGISNGGFMAHRMGCDHADQVAAIVSISGAQFADPSACAPSRAVSALEVHGTADDTVLFNGGSDAGAHYPSVHKTVAEWRVLDKCDVGPGTTTAPLDADSTLTGAETVRTSWSRGCVNGADVALWTVRGGGHVPEFTPDFTDAVLDWLIKHSRPRD